MYLISSAGDMCDMAKLKVTTTTQKRSSDGIPLLPEVIPAKTLDAMLKAEADVVEPEVVRNAEEMLHGPYWQGLTAEAVTRKKPAYGKGENGERVRELVLTFTRLRDDKYHKKSKDKDRRNAAIAFINEYGARGIPPRPFMSKAVDDKEEEAKDAGEAVFNEWADKNM